MKKVFISSRQDELAAEREEIHRALQSPDWDNFTFEWSGAFDDPADKVYLAEVGECDIYFGMFYKTYSPATVAEYREAKRLEKPVLIYIKRTPERDPELARFIHEEIQSSHKYQEFDTPEQLIGYLPDIRRALEAELRKQEIRKYLSLLIARCELLDFGGVQGGYGEAINIDTIFVPLGVKQASVPGGHPDSAFRPPAALKSLPAASNGTEEPGAAQDIADQAVDRAVLENALLAHRRLVILGRPGSGKSTLLRHIAMRYARSALENNAATISATPQDTYFPILVPLRRFAGSGQSLLGFLHAYSEQWLQLGVSDEFFERPLEEGHCIVCLDGLDEVYALHQRLEVRDAIASFAVRYPRNRIVVTSRVIDYEGAQLDRQSFAHFELLPFTEQDIGAFAHKWYAARDHDAERAEAQAVSLLNTIRANDRLRVLAENPLMLTIMAVVHRAEAELPSERVKLYDKCSETLLSSWEGAKGPVPEDRGRPFYVYRRRLLEKLAFTLQGSSASGAHQAEIRQGDLEQELTRFLLEDDTLLVAKDQARIEAQVFVEFIRNRTGILVEHGEGVFSFAHLTFQEYFAACDLEARYVQDVGLLWKMIEPHIHDPQWQEVILLLVGRLGRYDEPASSIVQRILGQADGFDQLLHRNLFLAARCLGDHSRVKEKLRVQIARQLLKLINPRRPRYAALQSDVLRALGELRDNTYAVEGLTKLASSGQVDPWTRTGAAQALGKLGRSDEAVGYLTDMLRDQKMKMWWGHAVMVLARFDPLHASVKEALASVGQDTGLPPVIRYELGRDLRWEGHLEIATSVFGSILKDEKVDISFRRDAARALGELESVDKQTIEFMLGLAQNQGSDPELRSASAEGLGYHGRADVAVATLTRLAGDSTVPAIARFDAARALGQLGAIEESVNQLSALAQNDDVMPLLRVYSAYAWARFRSDDDAYRLLLALTAEKADEIGIDAIRHLMDLGRNDELVCQGLQALASDVQLNGEMRYNAALALGKLGCSGQQVEDTLLALAQNHREEPFIRVAAAQALWRVGKRTEAIRVLKGLGRHTKLGDWVRLEQAVALGHLGSAADAKQGLLKLARGPRVDRSVRSNAITALGEFGQGDKQIALALARLARDHDWWTRDVAYRSLKQMIGNAKYSTAGKRKKVKARRR